MVPWIQLVSSEMYVHFIGNFDMLDEPEGRTDNWLDGHIAGIRYLGKSLKHCKESST